MGCGTTKVEDGGQRWMEFLVFVRVPPKSLNRVQQVAMTVDAMKSNRGRNCETIPGFLLPKQLRQLRFRALLIKTLNKFIKSFSINSSYEVTSKFLVSAAMDWYKL